MNTVIEMHATFTTMQTKADFLSWLHARYDPLCSSIVEGPAWLAPSVVLAVRLVFSAEGALHVDPDTGTKVSAAWDIDLMGSRPSFVRRPQFKTYQA